MAEELVFFALLLCNVEAAETKEENDSGHHDEKGNEPHHGGHEAVPADSVLLSILHLLLGCGFLLFAESVDELAALHRCSVYYWNLHRSGATRIDNHNLLNESITEFWLQIESELLLVTFLPGLLYYNAAG